MYLSFPSSNQVPHLLFVLMAVECFLQSATIGQTKSCLQALTLSCWPLPGWHIFTINSELSALIALGILLIASFL